MGLVFDQHIARLYEAWCRSPHGRAIDRSIEQLLPELLDPQPGDRVLDIGCGSGSHLLILNRLGLDVSGIDASPFMLHRARERLGARCLLERGRAEDLPFEDNEFDHVVLINTLEFLEDPLCALREAGRVANKKVFIGVINGLSWKGFLKRVQGLLGNPLFTHTRFYHLWELKSLFHEALGPVPISWRSTPICPSLLENIPPFLGGWSYWKRAPFGCFLGASAKMLYRMKTDNLSLRICFKKANQSVIGGQAP